MIVAVDGPAGSGKGTVTKLISERLGLVNIDTGAMYRCVALECLNKGIGVNDTKKIEEILKKIDIKLRKEDGIQKVYLNDVEVTEEIRTTRINENVAKYSAVKQIREKITPLQQAMGINNDIIMEGRDIGTVVFPDADVKIYLDCSVEERANRRYKQNLEKGIECTYEEVLEGIKQRHILETTREVAPFVKANDAVTIDSTNMTIEEVVDKIEEIIKESEAWRNER